MIFPRRRTGSCCDGFKELIENAGKKGFSALISKESGYIVVRLCHRSIEGSTAEIAESLGARATVVISLAGAVQMSFCPYCGYSLRRLVVDSGDRFLRLATAHQHLASELGIQSGD